MSAIASHFFRDGRPVVQIVNAKLSFLDATCIIHESSVGNVSFCRAVSAVAYGSSSSSEQHW